MIALLLIASLVRAQEPRTAEKPSSGAATRTIEFETTQVTQADVTVSPDDRWLVFTILGDLFRMPIGGGNAEQLTFGPFYDSDPTFSPDGSRIALVSDREDSERNVFVLDLASRRITQVTREPWADRPAWTPNGQALVYMSLLGEPRELRSPAPPAVLRRAQLNGEKTETVIAERRPFTSVFHLADGHLAWSVIESQDGFSRGTSRVEVLSDAGVVSTVGTFDTYADRVIASHAGEGLYCRCYSWPWCRGQDVGQDATPTPVPSARRGRRTTSGSTGKVGMAAEGLA